MKVHTRTALTALLALPFALALPACQMMQEDEPQAAAEEAGPLSDPQIVAVLATLNRGEIRQAETAMQRSDNPEVLDVAERIITDHLGMQRRTETLAESADIPPEENALSRQIEEQAQQLTAQLGNATGNEFDRLFLQGQAQLHQLALDTVRNELLPAAQNPQLRQMLQEAAPALEAHLDEARQSRQAMSG